MNALCLFKKWYGTMSVKGFNMYLTEREHKDKIKLLNKQIKSEQKELDRLLWSYEQSAFDSTLTDIQLLEKNIDDLYDELIQLDFQEQTR